MVQGQKIEIQSRKEVDLLVNLFYTEVLKDELIGPRFKHLDFDKHLPRMVDFWCFILLDHPGYSDNVIQKHIGMNLKKADFDRWNDLFLTTLEKSFIGEKVELAKQKLIVLKWTMESKSL
jgi:hemoglobin